MINTRVTDSLNNEYYIDKFSGEAYKSAFFTRIVKELKSVAWIKLNDLMYYHTEKELLIADPEKIRLDKTALLSTFRGFNTTLMNAETAKELFYTKKEDCPFIKDDNIHSYYNGNYNYVACDGGMISIEEGDFIVCSINALESVKIPVHRTEINDFLGMLLEKRVYFDSDNVDGYRKKFPSYFELENSLEEYDNDYSRAAESIGISESEKIKARKQIKLSEEETDEIVSCVVSADYNRCELECENEKCVEDVNLGHWELWGNSENGLQLARNLVARNPVADIRKDGVVGIDFGTKSTIVSFMDGNDVKKLHRIGIGQISKTPKPSHYENPTVMEFIDIGHFLETYNAEKGRPHTSIEDLTVSHKANNSLKNSESSDIFYSFFYDIKQWCGDSNRYKNFKLIDQNHHEYLLPPYLDIKDGEFDPVEIYAYYLGLYINNMRNGIYMNYILSFPVAYEKAVKEKLLRSFTAGIKKSLPDAVLDDEEQMERFKIVQGVSEPAAYAITALQTYGFDPYDENEKYFYGIFDFGGGTTDFDFGIWRGAADTREERKYNYVIEHFGSEGDKFLGGENLLELAAFEIFKDNRESLLKNDKSNGFSFAKPSECEAFPGSEALISDSQEAKRNTRQLVEKIRPIWEGTITESQLEELYDDVHNDESDEVEVLRGYVYTPRSSKETAIENSSKAVNVSDVSEKWSNITVDLFDKEGIRISAVKLDIDYKKIVNIFKERIEMGVRNFFEALKLTFKNHPLNDTEKVHIFLAGNSCKSPIVKYCFNKYIENCSSEIIKYSGNSKDYFYLYPPLGTEEARTVLTEKNLWNDELSGLYAPTCKTGVALGLLEGRKGGAIKVISELKASDEAKFRYYIGKNRKNKFLVVFSRDDEYEKWKNIGIPADDEEFELYYTTLPEVTTNDMKILGISKKRCLLSDTNEDADIYIRAISPTQIEYCAAIESELIEGRFVSEPQIVDLSD